MFALRSHLARTRHLSVSASAAGGAGYSAAFRRGAAATRPDQRAVFAVDVAEPSGATADRERCHIAGDGPHDVDGRAEAARTTGSRGGSGGSGRQAGSAAR